MKSIKKLVVGLLAICLLAGCSSTPQQAGPSATPSDKNEPVMGGTYIIRQSSDPATFNPNLKTDDMGVPVFMNVFSRLVKTTASYNIAPDLAKSWEFSDDGLTLTFNLQQGVKWHDGQPFSADDVKWTFDKIMSEGYMAPNFTKVQEVTCTDENTVVFHLKEADAGLLASISWLGVFILPKHIYEGTDWSSNPANMKPIGTGPFKFDSYAKGQQVVMIRNDEYFGGKPYLDKVIMSIIPDANTAFQAFKNGEVDDMQLGTPASEIASIKQDLAFQVYEINSNNRTYVTFNMETGPFTDVKVREAVMYAINRQEVLDKAAKGIGSVAEYFMSPVYADAMNQEAILPARDVNKAKTLLEEAGLKADGDGNYLSVTLDLFDSSDFVDTATVIASNLKEAGIDVKINISEMGTWIQKVQVDGNFTLAMCSGAQGPDISAIQMRVGTKGALNLARYNSAEMEALLMEGTKVTDPAARAEVYKQVQALMAKDLPIIPIKETTFTQVIKANVVNHPYSPEMADLIGPNEYSTLMITK